MGRHIHLDLVGGLSGDMFIGAVLDCFPELNENLEGVITNAGFPDLVQLASNEHNDGTITGTRFHVNAAEQSDHHHRHFSEIKSVLGDSNLSDDVKRISLAIFQLIAEVEAAIHGKSVADVAFHEVGAWDSIADVVLASHLINELDATWSVSPVPQGRGFVETAHGRLPVPAPATAALLEGFEVIDDGIEGERVTPTGAAILKFLQPATSIPSGLALGNTGFGFGTKTFPGIANAVRLCSYTTVAQDAAWYTDQIMKLSFELDDQTPESIAVAVDRLRDHDGVLDVSQQVFWGKKNRQGFALVVLARLEAADEVTSLCFTETTTLGVRRETIERAILPREEVVVYVGERSYRVKVAKRPNGYTAKVEMDDLIAADLSLSEQEQVRRSAEQLAIEQVSHAT